MANSDGTWIQLNCPGYIKKLISIKYMSTTNLFYEFWNSPESEEFQKLILDLKG